MKKCFHDIREKLGCKRIQIEARQYKKDKPAKMFFGKRRVMTSAFQETEKFSFK